MPLFLQVCMSFFLCTAFCSAETTQKKPPNIIWFYADDIGYNDVGFKNPDVVTPNLDRLAKEGVTLSNHYVLSLCTPSRAALLSGRYPYKIGMQHAVVMPFQHWCLPLQYRLLPSYLKDLGYSTYAFGKWHIGHCRKECTAVYRGFDRFSGGYGPAAHYYNHTIANRYDWFDGINANLSVRGIHSQDILLHRTLDTLDNENGSRPFFLYVAFHNPHAPLQPKPKYLNLYRNLKATDTRRKYLGLVTGMDEVIGQIIDKLHSSALAENSIVIFATDNGADPKEGDNSPFRGGKGSLYEGGTKGLIFVWSPLLEKTGYQNDGLIHITDWLPTLVKLAGGGTLSAKLTDGVDQSEMILRGAPSSRTHMVYNIDREYDLSDTLTYGEIGVRNRDYKLLWGMPGQTDGYGLNLDYIFNLPFYQEFAKSHSQSRQRYKRGGPYFFTPKEKQIIDIYMETVHVSVDDLNTGTGFMQLFNLQDDPYETTNLVNSSKPEDQEALAELVQMVQYEIGHNYQHLPLQWDHRTPWKTISHGMMSPGFCQDTVHLPSTMASLLFRLTPSFLD